MKRIQLIILFLSIFIGKTYGQIIQIPDPSELLGDDYISPFEVNHPRWPIDYAFDYSDEKNLNNFTDNYGRTTKDVFYKFRISVEMDIVISHCGSSVSDTYLYLLDSSCILIASNDNYSGPNACSNTKHAYIAMNRLSPGTYYVVSEGYNTNGYITTRIQGTIPESTPTPLPAPLNLSADRNYIRTIVPTLETSTTENLSTDESLQNVQYVDGLGRPMQNVQIGTSLVDDDLVTYQEYDLRGRESNTWLPSVATSNKGAFVPLSSFQANAKATYNADGYPYARNVYEDSPLSRLLKQYGAGQDWHNNNKAVETSYFGNMSGYVCKRYDITDNRKLFEISQSTIYATAQLFVTCVKDEDGKASYQFKDKSGHVVLNRSMEGATSIDTYYLYDKYGNLRVVLPPIAADQLSSGSWNGTETPLVHYAYLYKYDDRNRLIAKKLPGSEWIYYIYDKEDRLIFTQDGVQRSRGEWLFSIPDKFGRTVVSGVVVQTLNYEINPLGSVVVVGTRSNATSTYKGYTLTSGVLTGTVGVHTVTYYDDYAFMGYNNIPAITNSDYKPETVANYGICDTDKVKGLQTGLLTAMFNADGSISYLPTIMYYDNRGRLVQVKSGSHLTGGIEKEYIGYRFIGNIENKMHIHSAIGKTTQTEFYTYTYDHAERLAKVEHQLQVGSTLNSKVTLAEYTYDELGRQQTRKYHGGTANLITYTYNIRSWLTEILSTKFTQNLYYNTGNGTHKWNGNISSMTWKAGNETTVRGYKFAYDGLNRLTDAIYGEEASISTNPDWFTEKVTGYDKHGNITGLQRHGKISSSGHGLIDNLSFGYVGNQMKYVNDAVTSNPVGQSFQFVNGSSSTGDEYTYDANGNMTKDLNKNITDIQYNLLNLPKKLQLSSGGVATYTYDAVGVKRKVEHQGAGENKTTDYCGNVIYENGALSKILTDEGYITLSGTAPTYHYYLKDHLGNNRVVLNQNGTTVEQMNHYYPFGGLFDQISETLQAYKFGGKELDRTYGIDLYDYSARFMDGAVGRFTTMDPLSEKYYSVSPYGYVMNNPVRYVDPKGKDVWDFIGGIIHSVGSNLSLGTVPTNTNFVSDAGDYNAGRTVGDVVSVVMGIAEVFVGGGTAVGGSAATVGTAGVGSIVTVPAAATGVGMVVHGSGVTGTAIKSLANQEGRVSEGSSNRSGNTSTRKGSLSGTKKALEEAQEKVGGSLPKGKQGKMGSPQRGDSKKGYRLDPGHPDRPSNDPESGPHINWWDYSKGKRNSGGRSGAIPID